MSVPPHLSSGSAGCAREASSFGSPLPPRMIAKRLLVAFLCLALLAPVALASTGPFTGKVRQGQTRTHHYDNNPGGAICPALLTTYSVVLEYTPTSDTLTLEAGGQTATGSNGFAAVSFEGPVCTSFNIKVTGTSVASSASYVVTVTSGGAVA